MKHIDLSKYGSNQAMRKKYFCPSSISHPAKMDLPLCRWIIDKFCNKDKPEIILDPMCGIGSTLIMGMLMRPQSLFIGIELEDKFVKMTQDNINKVEKLAERDMFLKVGRATVIKGDARNLQGLLNKEVDKIISSPPFGPATSGRGIAKKGYKDKHGEMENIGGRSYMPENVGETEGNLSNLPYVEKIISSPPYADTPISIQGGGKEGQKWNKAYKEYQKTGDWEKFQKEMSKQNIEKGYGADKDNIGNTKGQNYLEAMLLVYKECWKVLRPKGLMILTIKDFIRDKKRIPLGEDTIKLCELAGFTYLHTYYRKIENPSFWRKLYEQKFPEVEKIENEDILVFKK